MKAPNPENQTKTVLIVDDEEDIRETLRFALELEGFKVLRAENGKAALAVLAESSVVPSLILLDLMMPVMDGYEFLERMHADSAFRDIPIVVISAFNQRDPLQHARAFLRKPLGLDALLEAVDRYVA
jgi:CheY-like chemotaxis protein